MSSPETPKPRLRWTANAIALLVIGLLILIPSGLCTAGFGIMALVDFLNYPENSDGASFVAEAVIVGGPFILVGAALVYGALRARKPK